MRLRLPVARIVSVLLFAALCAIAAGWALQLLAPRPPIAPAGAVSASQVPSDLSIAGRLFGAAPVAAGAVPQVAAPSNIQVAGVVAAGARSVALLAVDGRPAKPFAVGDTVGDGLKVRSVAADAVMLEGSAGPMRLPAPPRGSIDVLTAGPQRAATGGATVPPVGLAPPPPGGQPFQPGIAPLPARPLPPSGAAAESPQGDAASGIGPTGAVGVPSRMLPQPGAFTAPPPPDPGQPGSPPGQ